jgi:hypothetical protein
MLAPVFQTPLFLVGDDDDAVLEELDDEGADSGMIYTMLQKEIRCGCFKEEDGRD